MKLFFVGLGSYGIDTTLTLGTRNTFCGFYSGYNMVISGSKTSGGDNTGMGYFSLYNINSGSFNTGYGSQVMFSDSSGNYNSAFGYKCFYANTSGSYNTANGYKALYSNTNGNYNTAFGYDALTSNNTGYKNTSIGYRADVSADNLKNATAIGANAIVNATNKVRIGDENVTIVESSAGSWTTSDARFKTNIKEEVIGLDFIKLLKPVVYNFEAKKFHEFLTQNYTDSLRSGDTDNSSSKISQVLQSGFLAQQVYEAAKKCGYNFNGVHAPENSTDNWSLSYEKLVVPLVKAVQELNTKTQELDTKTKEMEADKKRISDLENKVDQLTQLVEKMTQNKVISFSGSLPGGNASNPTKGL